MNEKHIEQNIQWLRETFQSIEGINEQILSLVNLRKTLELQIKPMIEVIKSQLDKGNITYEDLIGLENIFNKNEIETDSKQIIKGELVSDLVYSIFIENQMPLHFKEILLQINNKGFIVNGKDPGLNLVAYLSKDKRFIKGDKRGYWRINDNY